MVFTLFAADRFFGTRGNMNEDERFADRRGRSARPRWCYGDTAVKAPNLDRLAASGVHFDRASAECPVSNASRTSSVTGLQCEQTGVVGNNTVPHARDRA